MTRSVGYNSEPLRPRIEYSFFIAFLIIASALTILTACTNLPLFFRERDLPESLQIIFEHITGQNKAVMLAASFIAMWVAYALNQHRNYVNKRVMNLLFITYVVLIILPFIVAMLLPALFVILFMLFH